MSDLTIALIIVAIYGAGAVVAAIIIRIVDRINSKTGDDEDDEDDLIIMAFWPLVLIGVIFIGGGCGFLKGCEYIAKKIVPDKIRVEECEKTCYTPDDLAEVERFLEEDNVQPKNRNNTC